MNGPARRPRWGLARPHRGPPRTAAGKDLLPAAAVAYATCGTAERGFLTAVAIPLSAAPLQHKRGDGVNYEQLHTSGGRSAAGCAAGAPTTSWLGRRATRPPPSYPDPARLGGSKRTCGKPPCGAALGESALCQLPGGTERAIHLPSAGNRAARLLATVSHFRIRPERIAPRRGESDQHLVSLASQGRTSPWRSTRPPAWHRDHSRPSSRITCS